MSRRFSLIPEAVGFLWRFLKVNCLLAIALGLMVIGQHAILKAQGPAPGANPAASAPTIAAPSATPSPAPPADGYLICPNDVLDIYVYDVPELSHTYTVSPSGTIGVPLLPDPIQAAGLSPDQLARAMEKAFRDSGRLRRPEIAVTVKQSRNLSVTVDGAVKNPLVLAVVGQTKLVDVLTQCGGLAEDAGANVTIARSPLALKDLAIEGGVTTPILTLDLKKVMDGSDPASAVMVWPGDRVSVQRAGVYYVMGEVRSPGGYNLKNTHDELTVLRALALAGDLTPVAKKNKAMIIRKDPKGPQGRQEIKLDLQSILTGKSADPVLQADDILFIPGSGGKKALRTLEGVPGQALGSASASALIVH
jgi:polysaccharide export outer membrane protein